MKPGDLVRIPSNINGDPERFGLVLSTGRVQSFDDFDGDFTLDVAQILIDDTVTVNYSPWSLEVIR